ncbi:MAG: hypothetical protein ACOYI7_10610 [Candidatus Excrementavichristensenella sp.]|jgi:hypothetical protein
MKRTGKALSRGCGGTPAKGWMTLLLALILLPEPFAVDMDLPDAERAPHAIEKKHTDMDLNFNDLFKNRR